MKISGVYKIQSKINPDRIYIGSSIDVMSRKSTHYSSMKAGYANNRLVRHFIEFGSTDLEFTIMELCLPIFLREREQHYIDLYKPYFNNKNTNGTTLHTEGNLKTRWVSMSFEEIVSTHKILDDLRKTDHKKHMAKYQIK